MEPESGQGAKVDGAGSAVNIHFGDGFKQFQILLICLIGSLVVSCAISLFAIVAAINASKEARLDSYWLERAEVACASKGIILPPPPTIPK